MSSDLPLRAFPFGSDRLTAVVTTRHGGVSTGPYGSLNLGGHVGDRPEAVAENRRRLAAALGVDRLTIADQKHTATVAVVDGALAGRGHDGVADSAAAFPGTDAMITNLPDVALTILVADCAPVVLYDPVRRAAGVAHSGRVGTVKGVIPQTIKAMAATFGSDPADLLIGIGPAIGAASYEIGAAEAAEVMAAFGAAGTRLLTPTRSGRATFDLAAAIRRQLAAAAVPAGNVHDMSIDTRTGTGDFFSDRAARPCGRFAAIARLHRPADDSPARTGASVLTRSPALTLVRCKLCARCKESAREARFFFLQYGIFLLYGVFTLIWTPQTGRSCLPSHDSHSRGWRVAWADEQSERAARAVTPGLRELFLVGAGAVAGLVGTAGGITSLVSYPALLLAGVAPLQANIANLVALVACWPGSAVASQPELRGRGPWLLRWGIVAAVGGTAGSLLLLNTSAGVFGRVVPFLVAAGSLALLFQPWLAARPSWQDGDGKGKALLLPAGLLALSVYNGYFGAGSGVLLLALLLLTTDPVMARANALKNMVVGAATITSAVLFAVLTRVEWAAVAALAAGLFCGSLAGPWVARRLPPGVLRWLVALTGLALAIRLWLDPAG